jgi:hypothetical protein
MTPGEPELQGIERSSTRNAQSKDKAVTGSRTIGTEEDPRNDQSVIDAFEPPQLLEFACPWVACPGSPLHLAVLSNSSLQFPVCSGAECPPAPRNRLLDTEVKPFSTFCLSDRVDVSKLDIRPSIARARTSDIHKSLHSIAKMIPKSRK